MNTEQEISQSETRVKINGRANYRISAEDIKHKDRLTIGQIQDIPLDTVYMWVRTGEWKNKDFMKWCKALRIIE